MVNEPQKIENNEKSSEVATATTDKALFTLFFSFLKIGLFTFGGGYAMIGIIEQEIVDRRGWISKREFLDLLTLAQSIPGPIALNTAAFVGYKTRGYRGTLVSLAGIVVPSFTVILLVALFFDAIRDNHYVEAAFKAMRPVVVALIIAPTISLMRGLSVPMIIVGVACLALFITFNLSPLVLIAATIVVAIGWTKYFNTRAKQ